MTMTRIKTILAIIVSFFISLFIINYSQFPDSPYIDTSQIASDIKETTFNITEKINPLKIISSITLPNFFSINTVQTPNPHIGNQNNVIPSSSTDNTQPTPIIPSNKKISPTTPARYPTIKKRVTPTTRPTSKPTPSTTLRASPKPTTIPPTPTEIPIGKIRPGKNLDEVMQIATKKTCTPMAIFQAIAANESGDKNVSKFATLSSSSFRLYNTYNWWNEKSTSLNQVCDGIAYNHHTGLVPSGSQYGNSRCMGAETFSTDIQSMGYLSISQWEEDSYRQRVLDLLKVDKIDRRVIFDSTIIAGLHFKNISTNREKDCDNWEAKYIVKTACKYLGRCNYDWGANKGNYCQEVCDRYNKFTLGEKVNCKNASSLLVNNGNDGKCTIK